MTLPNRLIGALLAGSVVVIISSGCASAGNKEAPPKAEAAGPKQSAATGDTSPEARERGTGEAKEAPPKTASAESKSAVVPDPSGTQTYSLATPVDAEVVGKGSVSVSSEPSLASKAEANLEPGTKLRVTAYRRGIYVIDGRVGRWVQVDAAGRTGWVFGGSLSGPSVATGGALPTEAAP